MACGDDVGTAPLIGLLPAAAEDSCQFVSRESRFLRLDVGRRSAAWPAGPLRTRQCRHLCVFVVFLTLTHHVNKRSKRAKSAHAAHSHAAPSTRICLTPLTIIHKTLPCLNANHGIGSPSRHGTAVRLNRPALMHSSAAPVLGSSERGGPNACASESQRRRYRRCRRGSFVDSPQQHLPSRHDFARLWFAGTPRSSSSGTTDKLIAQAKIEYPVFQEEAVATA